MYIIKNALRNIWRSKVRSCLIGIILLILALSSCIGLSIQQAAKTSKEASMELTNITAQIEMNREYIMEQARENSSSQDGREMMKEALGSMQSLSLEELQTYADSSYVKSFYYTGSISLNGNDDLEAVESQSAAPGGIQGGKGGNMPSSSSGDFTITGYSSDEAMTSFIDGTNTISEGSMFQEGTSDASAIISSELASLNDITVNDTITFTDPSDEDTTIKVTVVGIYESSSNTSISQGPGGMNNMDQANQIYMSYASLQSIADNYDFTIKTNGTYVFQTVEDYEKFEEDCHNKGLDESYTVTSSDLTSFEQSLLPLENLSTYALYFVVVVLAIGGIVLFVLNIFSIRERKYEIGILCAIGMKKIKVACQFLCEMFIIAGIAVLLGVGIGALTSIPVTNALLENQIQSNQYTNNRMEQNFSRPDANSFQQNAPEIQTQQSKPTQRPATSNISYVTSVSEAMNLQVIIQMIGLTFILVFISSAAGLIFIMRYDPLMILTNRD